MPSDSSVTVPSNRYARRHPDKVGRRYASIPAAAEYLGVSTKTVHQMITDGRLVGYNGCGNRIFRVDLNQLDNAMEPAS
jgi:excisionase family DNA binding protein